MPLPSRFRVYCRASPSRAREALERIAAKPLPPLTDDEAADVIADLNAARAQGIAVVRVDMRRGAPVVQSDRPVTIRAPRD